MQATKTDHWQNVSHSRYVKKIWRCQRGLNGGREKMWKHFNSFCKILSTKRIYNSLLTWKVVIFYLIDLFAIFLFICCLSKPFLYYNRLPCNDKYFSGVIFPSKTNKMAEMLYLDTKEIVLEKRFFPCTPKQFYIKIWFNLDLIGQEPWSSGARQTHNMTSELFCFQLVFKQNEIS